MISLTRYDADPARRLAERERAAAAARGKPHVLLETCDRLELYAGEGAIDDAVLRHLAGVAAGLDSPLPGEKAVQGQVKAAYAAAVAAGSLGASLHVVFQAALGMAKRVRCRTGIDRGCVSHAGAVARLLHERGLDSGDCGILVLGVNDLAASLLRYLSGRDRPSLILANRNRAKAQALAELHDARWAGLDAIEDAVADCRVLVSATAAPHYIVYPHTLAARAGRELLAIDLSAPPDLHPACADLPGVELVGLRQLEERCAVHLQERRELLPEAWRAMDEELAQWRTRRQLRQRWQETQP